MSGSSFHFTQDAEMNVGSGRGGHVYLSVSLFTVACRARGEHLMRKAWHAEAKQTIIKLKNVFRVEQFQDKLILNRCLNFRKLTATLNQAAFPCLWDFFCPYFGAPSHGNTNGNCVFIIHCEQPSVVYPPETQLSYIQTLVLLPAFLLNCNELPSVSNGAAEYRSPSENSRY